MPLTKVDYSKTIIYKIQHKEIDELLYVGSTTDFTRRKAQHKRACDNANNKCHNFKVYETIRDNGGFDCFNIIVIKDFPCNTKQEALMEEDKIMRQMKCNMNSRRAYQTHEERVEYTKQYDQLYKEKHREKIREQSKEYSNMYREAYYETLNEKVSCPCGGKYLSYNKSRHFKTKKHQDFVNTTEQ